MTTMVRRTQALSRRAAHEGEARVGTPTWRKQRELEDKPECLEDGSGRVEE